MDYNKEAFIRLALDSKVLKFGEFTLKSGRISPYFFNAGEFNQGNTLQLVGKFYAQVLIENNVNFQHLFGPAYKGIPLATATAIALAELGQNVSVTFNRKEIKHHGEQGKIIGAQLFSNTVIIDDVITAGTAFREAQTIIKQNGGQLVAVIIALDRCEQGLTKQSALTEIAEQGIKIYSIITIYDLIDYLRQDGELYYVEQLLAYQKKYGIHF